MESANRFFFSILCLALAAASYGVVADKERVEEGRYAVLKNGGLVAGTEHTWKLWRLPDGRYEFEDHFRPGATSAAIRGGLLSSGAPMTPGFRKSLEQSVEPSDLAAIFDQDSQLLSIKVTGKKLDGGTSEGLSCKASARQVECKGTSNQAKLRLPESCAFFWWFDIPMMLRPWLSAPQSTSLDSSSKKIAILSFGNLPKQGIKVGMKFEPGAIIWWGDAPKLELAGLTIANGGPDTLALGDRSFHAQKFQLDFKVGTGDPVSLTAWVDVKGTILAVADASRPGELMALVEYKNYANHPAGLPDK